MACLVRDGPVTPRRLVVLAGVALVLVAPAAVDPVLVAGCGACLALIGAVLLAPGAPPVFALVVGYQWAQVAVATLYANATGEGIEGLYPVGDVVLATAYGLLAIATAALALGLLVWRFPISADAIGNALRRMSVLRLVQCYAALGLIGLPLERMVGVGGQAAQLVQAFVDLRWALLFLLVAAALVQRRGALWSAAAVTVELAIGFSGFFAGFAEPLMLALLAFLSVFAFLRPHQRVAAAALAIAMLGLGVIWQGFKNEYRREVSGGTGEQVVVIGLGERYATLGRMAGETVAGDVDAVVQKFALRLAYVQNFGLVLRRVPADLPHREGELLGAAIGHVFMPRILFPGKPPLPSDSELTAHYTANIYILYMTGTSISLGYVTELFIDFGLPGVVLAGLLLGMLLGGVHLGFRAASPDPALALALASGVLLSARAFETALPKLIGGVLAAFLVQVALLWLLRAWLLPLLRGESLHGAGLVRDGGRA